LLQKIKKKIKKNKTKGTIFTFIKEIPDHMKTTFKYVLLLLYPFSSSQDNDDTCCNLAVQDFIWKGLNQYYLWQADVPNLADDRFVTQQLNVFYQAIRFLKTI
jgi:hypothetical protein